MSKEELFIKVKIGMGITSDELDDKIKPSFMAVLQYLSNSGIDYQNVSENHILPLVGLLVHGTNDFVTDKKFSQSFYELLTSFFYSLKEQENV